MELSIKINIAGQEYPMSVEAEKEVEIRQAAVFLNKELGSMRAGLGIESKTDLLAMLAFSQLMQKQQAVLDKTKIESQTANRLAAIEVLIDRILLA